MIWPDATHVGCAAKKCPYNKPSNPNDLNCEFPDFPDYIFKWRIVVICGYYSE